MATEIRHEDRRSSPRSREAHLLTVTTVGPEAAGASVYVGRTLDLSERGVHIETREPLVLDQELMLEVAVANRILLARGRAVHTERIAEGRYGAGIRFRGEGLHG